MLIVLSNRSTTRKSGPQRSKSRAPRETLYPSRPLLGPLYLVSFSRLGPVSLSLFSLLGRVPVRNLLRPFPPQPSLGLLLLKMSNVRQQYTYTL